MKPKTIYLTILLGLFAADSFGQHVQIETESGHGLGVLVSVDHTQPVGDGFLGEIVTAAHVVEDQLDIRVTYDSGRRAKDCKVISLDSEGDVATVLVWVPPNTHPIKIAELDASPGDRVRFFGKNNRTSRSTAAAPTGDKIYSDLWLVPGDSGGAVLNASNELVGVTSGGWFWFEQTVEKTEKRTWPARACNASLIRKLLER